MSFRGLTMHRWLALALLAAVGIATPAFGAPQAEKKEAQEEAKTPAQELKAIQQDFSKKQQDFYKAYQAAKTQAEKNTIRATQQPDPTPFLERAIKLAQAHADSPAATDALLWVVQMNGQSPAGAEAQKLLAEGFVAKTAMADLASKLSRVRVFSANELAEAVMARAEKNLHDKDAPKLLAWVQSA